MGEQEVENVRVVMTFGRALISARVTSPGSSSTYSAYASSFSSTLPAGSRPRRQEFNNSMVEFFRTRGQLLGHLSKASLLQRK